MPVIEVVRPIAPAGGRGRVEVDADLVGILARNGFPRPIRCVRDPRLQHPELLLLGGWERFVPDQGVGYRFRVQEEPCMEQVVLFLPEGARELTTRVGERAQVLRLEPDGQVREVRRPGPAAKG